ncbi:MAG: class I mannose-6-phosphate isomerase [Planctomycetes bacterium]|nr:class I mannose-6-phosphate isomerase [Planctomycetota bacterium]
MLPLLKMVRVAVETAWGGRQLERVPGIALPPEKRIGETWELADHDAGMTSVEAPRAGTLRALMERHGNEVLGRAKPNDFGRFPLLFKFIHAAAPLSVQVHPDDAYAREHEGDAGKTEAWLILHAEPGARVIAGFRAGVSEREWREKAATSEVEHLLASHEVRPLDVIFVPAGTVHSIGPGIVLAEVQQNSNVTYRLYDWGRVGRTLHVRQALEVATIAAHQGPLRGGEPAPGTSRELLHCERFAMALHRGGHGARPVGDVPRVFLALRDGGVLHGASGAPVTLRAGDTALVPACQETYAIEAGPDALFLEGTPTELR